MIRFAMASKLAERKRAREEAEAQVEALKETYATTALVEKHAVKVLKKAKRKQDAAYTSERSTRKALADANEKLRKAQHWEAVAATIAAPQVPLTGPLTGPPGDEWIVLGMGFEVVCRWEGVARTHRGCARFSEPTPCPMFQQVFAGNTGADLTGWGWDGKGTQQKWLELQCMGCGYWTRWENHRSSKQPRVMGSCGCDQTSGCGCSDRDGYCGFSRTYKLNGRNHTGARDTSCMRHAKKRLSAWFDVRERETAITALASVKWRRYSKLDGQDVFDTLAEMDLNELFERHANE